MITTVTADGKKEYEFIEFLKNRAQNSDKDVIPAVSEIIENVKNNGDQAVEYYTIKFDGKAPEKTEIDSSEIDSIIAKCSPEYLETVKKAAANIADFHKRQVQQSWLTTKENGVIMGQRVRGLKRVGIYVPGGTAAYPSSVLMNAVPAKIAGVEEVVMCTPPQKDGTPNPNIIAAAKIAGVDRIFLMGGAQAVAAMAYGTQSVPKVDKIVGPGNIFVALAKKAVYGYVSIDSVAGPSEILLLADENANPKFAACDLMSQAEHDEMASAILITTSEELADKVIAEVDKRTEVAVRKAILEKSLNKYGFVLVAKDMDQAIDAANQIASEHLEILTKNPYETMTKIKNAGAIFLGEYSSEPLGDYFAGPNHVLPTNGTAKFFSPLSVDDFIKKSSIINFSYEGLKAVNEKIQLFAKQEGLYQHAESIRVRFEEE